MTELSLSTADPAVAAVQAIVVGLYQGDTVQLADQRLAGLERDFAQVGATGKVGEVHRLPAPAGYQASAIVGVGLGKQADLTPERVRRAAGAAVRALTVGDPVGSTLGGLDLGAAAEGHLLGSYQFTRYKQPSRTAPESIVMLVAGEPGHPEGFLADAERTLQCASVIARAVALARDLVNTAPNDLPPAAFADRAVQIAHRHGLEIEVLDEQALRDGGYGGVLAVGSGSVRPPRLIRLSYHPQGYPADGGRSVGLVGKGVTFDSGGLSIKPALGMERMTYDMAGAAAVLAATVAAAELQLPIAVIATIPLAENLPSGSAYRPGDIITHLGGKTSHILNTDAEGRLILADALVRAAQDDPDYLIDAATLTGAQTIALGNRMMAVLGTDEFRDRVAQLARETGEGGWAMPFAEELQESIESPFADLKNASWDRVAGMILAAHYLREFVPAGMNWAHLDVAGPAYNTAAPYGYTPTGGTGVPVRTLVATLQDIAARS